MNAKSFIATGLFLSLVASVPAEPAPPASPAPPPASPVPSAQPDPVSATELLPIRVLYTSMRSSKIEEIVLVCESDIRRQRFVDNELVTVSSMPLDRESLDRVLKATRKEDFRGNVRYTNPYLRDGGTRRMVTRLGEIEEYGIVDQEDTSTFPKSIVRLKGLFKLIDHWRAGTDPSGNILQAGPGQRQPLPETEIAETLFRLENNQPVDTTILCRALVSNQTTLRARAARRLGETKDLSIVQDLILALGDPSQHVGVSYTEPGMNTTRWWANESLKKLTHYDAGYRWDAPLPERERAIQKWVVWMKASVLK